MKKIIIILSILTITSTVFAQKTFKIDGNDDREIQTVFKKNKRDGFYGSLSIGYSPINDEHGMVVSSRGCWIMDHWFAFGIGGTAFVNNIEALEDLNRNNVNVNLAGGYGGFIFEPMLAPLKPIHVNFPILIGAGAVGTIVDYVHTYSSISYPNDFIWVVEPGVELEINFTKWMRLAAYGTYRYTSDIEITDISKDALRSYTVGLRVKFGLF